MCLAKYLEQFCLFSLANIYCLSTTFCPSLSCKSFAVLKPCLISVLGLLSIIDVLEDNTALLRRFSDNSKSLGKRLVLEAKQSIF
jgi:hypothetical protein